MTKARAGMADAAGTSRSRRMLALRVAILAWLLAYLPTYANAYGHWHFLQLCNLSVLLSCIGFFFRSRVLLSAQALGAIGIGALWLTDVTLFLATGRYLHGGTAYLWDEHIPWLARVLSIYHALLPLLLIAAIRRLGHHPRAFALQATIAGAVFLGTWLFLRDVENLNYMLAWPNGRVLFGHVWMHALATYALLCTVVYAPTHLILRACFPYEQQNMLWHDASPKTHRSDTEDSSTC